MAFTTDGIGLWEIGERAVRSGIVDSSGTATTTQPHTGSYCLHLNYQAHYITLPTPRADIYTTQWCRPTAGDVRIVFRIDGNEIVRLQYNNPYWDAYVDGVKVADGNIATIASEWQRVSCHIVIADAGTIDTKIDGITDIEYSGDTKPGAVTDIDEIGFYAPVFDTLYVDDWVFGSGGWPGDRRVEFKAVTSDITQAWTPSTGSDNYACVDERPPDDNDYVSCTTDQTDEYGVADFDATGKGIGSVTVIARVKKSDAGSDDKITLGMGDGVNTDDGTAESVLTSYEHHWYLSTTAPDGGAWTDTDVDNLQIRLLGDIA